METAAQLTLLRQVGCHEVQGYYMSRPVSPDEITSLLSGGQTVVQQPPNERAA